MANKFVTAIFGDYSKHEVKKLQKTVTKINDLADKYKAMDDKELAGQTPILKDRLAGGETLDDILPDAFAVCREAAERIIGLRHFDVQLIGGIVLHQGRIAEMKTGEGKTLVATLPAYLNALTGEGVHIVTVNDYLAKRDSEWMGKVYRFLGLSVGLIIHEKSNAERQEAYNCDITYGTNNEMGFDYLRDNMVQYKEQKVQRGHIFAIVDEVDSILIDEARTPLIISGKGDASTDLYRQADQFAQTLTMVKVAKTDDKQDIEENPVDLFFGRQRYDIRDICREGDIDGCLERKCTRISRHGLQHVLYGLSASDNEFTVFIHGVSFLQSFLFCLGKAQERTDLFNKRKAGQVPCSLQDFIHHGTVHAAADGKIGSLRSLPVHVSA